MERGLTKWRDLDSLLPTRYLESLFDDFFDTRMDRSLSAPLDIYDGPEDSTIRVELPGVDEKDLDVELKDGKLKITGKKEQTRKDGSYSECYYGTFTRSVALSDNLDVGNAKASYKDGVLEIKIPKKENEKPRKLEISS